MNYNAGQSSRADYQTPLFEQNYQRAVALALRQVTSGASIEERR